MCYRLRKVRTVYGGLSLKNASGALVTPLARCTARVTIENITYPVEFVVLSSCCHEVILGWDFLVDNLAVIDCVRETVFLSDFPCYDHPSPVSRKLSVPIDTILPPRSTVFAAVTPNPPDCSTLTDVVISPKLDALTAKGLAAPFSLASIQDGCAYLPITNVTQEPVLLPAGFVVAALDEAEPVDVVTALDPTPAAARTSTPFDREMLKMMVSSHLASEERSSLLELLGSYIQLFDIGTSPLGVAKGVYHTVDTGDAAPLRQRPYRVSASERAVIDKEVSDMLSRGIIRPSSSPWASPVVLVTKKDGGIRFCVDYRRLNKITRRDVYPMPRIDDALDALRDANFFSSLDLRSGYWQIPMSNDDIPKTAFTTPDGLYEFTVMPFGLSNAPATFERMMDTVLRGLRWHTCLCYLDDVIVFSRTFPEHLDRLRAVFDCFLAAGLQLNHKKCHFGCRQISVGSYRLRRRNST